MENKNNQRTSSVFEPAFVKYDDSRKQLATVNVLLREDEVIVFYINLGSRPRSRHSSVFLLLLMQNQGLLLQFLLQILGPLIREARFVNFASPSLFLRVNQRVGRRYLRIFEVLYLFGVDFHLSSLVDFFFKFLLILRFFLFGKF